MDPPEELEYVPWADLMARRPAARPWLAYLVAAALAAAALGATAGRLWGEAATATGPDTTLPAPEAEATSPSLPPLYSEADLMARPRGEDAGLAAMRAEWFVTDYFTADAEPSGSAGISEALGMLSPLPVLPQDDLEAGISYVEWARAFEVEELEAGRYRVSVAYRALGAPAEGAFRRLPVRAVEIVVVVSPDGGTAVVDLPSPLVLPPSPRPDPWPEGPSAPPEVEAAALREAALWGEAPEVLGSAGDSGGWRVVLTVADPAGTRWPIVLWMDAAGRFPAGG